jgi:MOSC domain-containing protein YiiM
MTNGGFGENFTMAGLLESEAAIGDTFRIGTALIQISQPRQPCWKLSQRWGVKDLALQVQNIGYTGWYFRVLEEGVVEAGQDFELVERPYPQWTIAEANRLMHHDKKDWDALAQFVECPALSKSWKKTFRMRLGRQAVADSGARLSGK